MNESVSLPQIDHLKLKRGAAGRLFVKFPYHQDSVARIKQIPGHQWNERCWSLPQDTQSTEHLWRLFTDAYPGTKDNQTTPLSRRNRRHTPEEAAFVDNEV